MHGLTNIKVKNYDFDITFLGGMKFFVCCTKKPLLCSNAYLYKKRFCVSLNSYAFCKY
jgi:hypothetical protein